MQIRPLLAFLSAVLLAAVVLFLTYNSNGNWEFVLPFRSQKLLMLFIVGYAIGVSTLLFQTLTHNPILTPSILGFDSLYLLTQTALVFFVGGLGFTQLDANYKFIFESILMLSGSLLLFRLLNKNNHDLARMILVGVIFGVLFRNLNNLLQRLINPDDFAIAQSASFANFNSIKTDLIWISLIITLLSLVWIWQKRHKLDILLLGKDYAIGLGIDYLKLTRHLLICCALLVSIATALVGPILFLGLLVSALVNAISPQMQHGSRIPLTIIISVTTLILGQTVFEQILKMQGVLSVVIEFFGGLIFIFLILRKKAQK